jgi:hypothetical protein
VGWKRGGKRFDKSCKRVGIALFIALALLKQIEKVSAHS